MTGRKPASGKATPKATPRKGKPGAPKRRRKGRGVTPSPAAIILILIMIPLLVLFRPTAVVIGIGMIPTLIAYFADKDPDKTAPLTVGALNAIGVIYWVLSLWEQHNDVRKAILILTDPVSLLTMYGAAGAGWAIYYGVPSAVASYVVMRSHGQISKLEGAQRKLVEEWGPEVATDTPGDALTPDQEAMAEEASGGSSV